MSKPLRSGCLLSRWSGSSSSDHAHAWGEVPIPSQDREAALLGAHVLADGANGFHSGVGFTGVEIDAPDVKFTQVTSKL